MAASNHLSDHPQLRFFNLTQTEPFTREGWRRLRDKSISDVEWTARWMATPGRVQELQALGHSWDEILFFQKMLAEACIKKGVSMPECLRSIAISLGVEGVPDGGGVF